MRVQIDMSLCIGSGTCTTIAPELFEFDEQGTVRVVTELVPEGMGARAEEAAACCPVAAIVLGA